MNSTKKRSRWKVMQTTLIVLASFAGLCIFLNVQKHPIHVLYYMYMYCGILREVGTNQFAILSFLSFSDADCTCDQLLSNQQCTELTQKPSPISPCCHTHKSSTPVSCCLHQSNPAGRPAATCCGPICLTPHSWSISCPTDYKSTSCCWQVNYG